MSIRVTVRQFQEQLPELLDRAARNDEEYIVQRDGEDYVVVVSARAWQRREEVLAVPSASTAVAGEEHRSAEIGRRLDQLGPSYRLSQEKQKRMEELRARQETTLLTAHEKDELEALANECDAIMLRRAQALHRVL